MNDPLNTTTVVPALRDAVITLLENQLADEEEYCTRIDEEEVENPYQVSIEDMQDSTFKSLRILIDRFQLWDHEVVRSRRRL